MGTGSIEDYLLQAERAKLCLDGLLWLVVPPGTPGREAIPTAVKSLKRTRIKANDLSGICYVTDLARATVICDTPHDLADVFELLTLNARQVCREKWRFRIQTRSSLYRVTLRCPLWIRCRRGPQFEKFVDFAKCVR